MADETMTLERWGFPNGVTNAAAPMRDGYWTPWHIAQAEIARLTAELEKCKEALRPFINATLTLDGKVIGLMREDFERASNAIDAARRSP